MRLMDAPCQVNMALKGNKSKRKKGGKKKKNARKEQRPLVSEHALPSPGNMVGAETSKGQGLPIWAAEGKRMCCNNYPGSFCIS